MMKNIHISKLTAALGCFALSVGLLWLHGTMEASLVAARARILALTLTTTGHLRNSELIDPLLRGSDVKMTATLALSGAGVFFCIGLILCVAAAFKRKAKPDNDSAS